jgi:hypothetical protein
VTLLRTRLLAAWGLFVLAALVGCASTGGTASTPIVTAAPAPPASTPTMAPTAAPMTAGSPAPALSPEARATAAQASGGDMRQTRVRFSVGNTEIILRVADNLTSRDFVSMLPLTLQFRDFNAMEKIGDLPRQLTIEGSTGSAPANGDLIYFIPWGNLGFFYDAARRDASFDDRVIPIGTIETGSDRLSELETGPVRVELIP